MKKMVENEVGMVQIGEAIIPCNTTPNTAETFDIRLVAKLGETVFYVCPEFVGLDNEGNCGVRANKIIKGTVCKIDTATGCDTCLYIIADDSKERMGAVQELFFRSFEEAKEVSQKVNEYTDEHPIWENDWYEVYKSLFQPAYHYTLKFPLVPNQTQKVYQRGAWHYIIPNRVVAFIERHDVYIEYQGKDTKPEYMGDRVVIYPFKPNYSWKYKIVPADAAN